MKKSRIYIAIAFLLGTMVFIGCQEERDYPPLVLGNSAAPVVTVANIADSLNETYTYLTVSSTMDGNIYYLALPQGSAAPTATEVIFGETTPVAASVSVEANESYTVKQKNLSSGGSFDIYAVAVNAEEGKPGAVVGPVSITCPDYTYPYVASMSPGIGEEWVAKNITEIVLTMNENVTLVNADMISIVDAFDESDLGIKGAVTVNGPEVTIGITGTFEYLTDVAVLIDSGAFVDAVGLLSPEYYIDDIGDYELAFSIEDFINMENFIGAYQCHELDYAYGGEYFYDVLLYQSDVYGINVINMFDYGVEATIIFEEDSCYIPDQPSGLSASGDPLYFTSEELVPDICTFIPGSYTDDGITIKISCWLYSPALGKLYFASDMEFTKYLTPGEKLSPRGNPERIAKGLKAFRKL